MNCSYFHSPPARATTTIVTVVSNSSGQEASAEMPVDRDSRNVTTSYLFHLSSNEKIYSSLSQSHLLYIAPEFSHEVYPLSHHRFNIVEFILPLQLENDLWGRSNNWQ